MMRNKGMQREKAVSNRRNEMRGSGAASHGSIAHMVSPNSTDMSPYNAVSYLWRWRWQSYIPKSVRAMHEVRDALHVSAGLDRPCRTFSYRHGLRAGTKDITNFTLSVSTVYNIHHTVMGKGANKGIGNL